MTLTQKDINEIEGIVKTTVKEEIKGLPTKDEFYSKMDDVMGELKTIREEQTLITHRVSDHEDRIEKIEGKLEIATA
jgi:predicted nuclease with TOPRIM domain